MGGQSISYVKDATGTWIKDNDYRLPELVNPSAPAKLGYDLCWAINGKPLTEDSILSAEKDLVTEW